MADSQSDLLPDWVNAVREATHDFIEMQSVGVMEYRFDPAENILYIAPCLTQLIEGAEDGEQVYPYFLVHTERLRSLFDEVLYAAVESETGEYMMDGKRETADISIHILPEPFDDAEIGVKHNTDNGSVEFTDGDEE